VVPFSHAMNNAELTYYLRRLQSYVANKNGLVIHFYLRGIGSADLKKETKKKHPTFNAVFFLNNFEFKDLTLRQVGIYSR